MDHYETSPVAVRTETAARMFDTTPVSIVNWYHSKNAGAGILGPLSGHE